MKNKQIFRQGPPPSRPQCSKNKKEEKEKKETKKKQQQNLTFLSELYERKKDTESNNKNQLEINAREVTRLNKYPLSCNRFRLSTISVFIRYEDRLSQIRLGDIHRVF